MSASVVLSPTISTVAFVSWVPPAAGTSWVEFGLGALDRTTPEVPTTTAPHEAVLLGLKAEETYRWRAVTRVGDVTYMSAEADVTTGPPPEGAPRLDVSVDAAGRDAASWIVTVLRATGHESPSTLAIYDRDGDPVWFLDAPSEISNVVTVKPGRDGRSLLYGFFDQAQVEGIGGIYRVSLDGRETVFTPTLDAHHDFLERADGTFAYLSRVFATDLDVEGELGTAVASFGVNEVAEAADPVAQPPVQVYDQIADYPWPAWWTCDHMIETDDFNGVDWHEWAHGNSLMPDPTEPDVYWVAVRYQDSLLKIDRTTRETLATIGGRHDDTDLPAGDGWSHGHMSDLWDGGFLMFDNNIHPTAASLVSEYAFDLASGHAERTRVWYGNEPTEAMADARRAANGNVFIVWAGGNRFEEATPDGVTVWEATTGDRIPGRSWLVSDLYALPLPF